MFGGPALLVREWMLFRRLPQHDRRRTEFLVRVLRAYVSTHRTCEPYETMIERSFGKHVSAVISIQSLLRM